MCTMANTLLSALGGSVLTMAGTLVWEGVKRRNTRRNLYRAIVAECNYNLSILDEVVNGLLFADGSFKRLSVEFFKTMRQQVVGFVVRADLLSALSRAIVDLELLNMQADFVFNGREGGSKYKGEIGQGTVDIVKKSISSDISSTISGARIGVRNSLNNVLEIVLTELNEKAELNEEKE